MEQKENYQSPPVGQEISCVMQGIDENLISNNEKLYSILLDALKQDNFGVLETICHNFEPQGFTSLILLSESHLAIHTYPEHNSVYFNLYSCRGPTDAEKTFSVFKSALNPKKILYNKNEEVPIKS